MWTKGKCKNMYNRTCDGMPHKQVDLRTYEIHDVDDTYEAFHPRCVACSQCTK